MVVVVVDVVSTGSSVEVLLKAFRAASKSFSIEIGVVDGVGHPVNSVLDLQGGKEWT